MRTEIQILDCAQTLSQVLEIADILWVGQHISEDHRPYSGGLNPAATPGDSLLRDPAAASNSMKNVTYFHRQKAVDRIHSWCTLLVNT
jgi:hypothetical protein